MAQSWHFYLIAILSCDLRHNVKKGDSLKIDQEKNFELSSLSSTYFPDDPESNTLNKNLTNQGLNKAEMLS